MYSAINKGLRMARGEILAYLNSDDLYMPWTLEVVVRAFGRHRSADFVYGDAVGIDDVTGRHHMHFQAPFNRDYVCRAGFLVQPAVSGGAVPWEAVGDFDETLKYVADCDYWMRASKRHRFVNVQEVVAVDREHARALRSASSEALADELRSVRNAYVTTVGTRHRVASVLHAIRATTWYRLTWVVFGAQAARRSRSGPWARFLSAGHTRVRVASVFRRE